MENTRKVVRFHNSRDEDITNVLSQFSPAEVRFHLSVKRWQGMSFTKAARPAPGAMILPRIGYFWRLCMCPKCGEGVRTPYAIISVSKDMIFDLFARLIFNLENNRRFCVLLRSTHRRRKSPMMFYSRSMNFFGYESEIGDPEVADLLVNDGFSAIAVFFRDSLLEVRIDEHKLILAYAYKMEDRRIIEKTLAEFDIPQIGNLVTIKQIPHFHIGNHSYFSQFRRLLTRLGVKKVKGGENA